MFDLLCKPSLTPKELLYTFSFIIFYIASSYFAQNKKITILQKMVVLIVIFCVQQQLFCRNDYLFFTIVL